MGDLVDLLGVQTGDIDLVRGGDDISGVDSSQGNTVDLEGAGDEENTLVEGLEEDDALAAEATGEEDQDGAGLERLPGSPRADGLADLERILLARQVQDVCTDIPIVWWMSVVWRSPSVVAVLCSCVRWCIALLSCRPAPSVLRRQRRLLLSTVHCVPLHLNSRFPVHPHKGISYREDASPTYLLGLGVILGVVPLLRLVRGGGDLPGRLAELLGLRLRRHGDSALGG